VSIKRRFERLETYYNARFMSGRDVQRFADALLLACQHHTDPDTFGRLEAEFDEIMEEAHRGDWAALQRRSLQRGSTL
jgi:hypothetical protein